MSGQNPVTVNIVATSAQPTEANFGTQGFLQYHTHNSDLERIYTDLPSLAADGFGPFEPAYLWATTVFEQDPHPPSVKIFRGTTAETQAHAFTPNVSTTGAIVGFTLTDDSGVAHAVYHTVAAGESLAQIATALEGIINGLTGIAATLASNTLTATLATAGKVWYPSAVQGGVYADMTPSGSPGTDLNNVVLVDNDWYGITGALMSAADITAVAAWAAANGKTHYYTTSDTANLTSGTGVGAALKAAGYKRSYGQFSFTPAQYGASALEALEFTKDPGTYTDAFKQLQGVTVDALNPTQRNNLTANNLNYYVNIGGVNCTFDGRSAAGQFMDLTRFLDALQNDIQLRVFTLIVNSDKVPYTAHGIAAIGAEVQSSLEGFVSTGALSNDPGAEPKVKLPDVATVSAADKLARQLNGVKFSCTYTDGIHSVVINGNVGL